jgi:antitoxin (DNA-binding transcriptional repressor) of toxin-antitoxin stability system
MCVNILDFEKNFSLYWAYVQAGKYIFLVNQFSQIVAVISPLAHTHTNRPHGLAKGSFHVPANFNEELPSDLLNEFYQ